METTIQVRVDNELKANVDELFASLGLDISTAIQMFLMTAMQTRELPFNINEISDRDDNIRRAIADRKAGVPFLTADEFLTNLDIAIKEGNRKEGNRHAKT